MFYSVHRELLQRELSNLGITDFTYWDTDEDRNLHFYWAIFRHVSPEDHCLDSIGPDISLNSNEGEKVLQGALDGKLVIASALMNQKLQKEIDDAVEKYTV